MSEYVGFSPPPTYFLHIRCDQCMTIANQPSKPSQVAYVGSMWVGVRILHTHSFFRKCFYSCLYTSLFVQLQAQHQGHLLIALKAGSIPRPFQRFHDRKTRLTALSLILVKDLLVSSMYTFTGESKLQHQPLHVYSALAYKLYLPTTFTWLLAWNYWWAYIRG